MFRMWESEGYENVGTSSLSRDFAPDRVRDVTRVRLRSSYRSREAMLTRHVRRHRESAFPRSGAFYCLLSLSRCQLCDRCGTSPPNDQAHLKVNLAEYEFRTYHGPDFGIVHRTRGAVLAGPPGRATAIDTKEQGRLLAVEFELAGAAAFFGMSLS
jgi:hypothetical protein